MHDAHDLAAAATTNAKEPAAGETTRSAPSADATGIEAGLAWSLVAPEAPLGGVVILHGAGSRKENHDDFALACRDAGLAALTFDARGHGESVGPMDARAIDDVAAMVALVRETCDVRVGLRGSSMGGYFALVAAQQAGADAVVAICPAPAAGLLRGVRAGRHAFAADHDAVTAFLQTHDDLEAARTLDVPLLLQHAEGDEVVPVAHSRAIHAAVPSSTLVVVPGGDHRSVQHDPALQASAIAFLVGALDR